VTVRQVLLWIGGGYAFKLVVVVLDTIPFYFGTRFPSRYLRIDPHTEHEAGVEEAALDASSR
jgi:hypothetical protein